MSLDPVACFLVLGFVACALRADLRLPAAIYEFVSTLLLLAIGMKGGQELARQPLEHVASQLVATFALGTGLALAGYGITRLFARGLPRADAASLAAHYGSVSVGT